MITLILDGGLFLVIVILYLVNEFIFKSAEETFLLYEGGVIYPENGIETSYLVFWVGEGLSKGLIILVMGIAYLIFNLGFYQFFRTSPFHIEEEDRYLLLWKGNILVLPICFFLKHQGMGLMGIFNLILSWLFGIWTLSHLPVSSWAVKLLVTEILLVVLITPLGKQYPAAIWGALYLLILLLKTWTSIKIFYFHLIINSLTSVFLLHMLFSKG